MIHQILGKLIKTPRYCYFYDTNRNEVVQISDVLYKGIEKVQKQKEQSLIAEELEAITRFQEEGYLSENRVQVVEHPITQMLPTFLSRKVANITLQVTQACNFRCSYCIYSAENNEGQRSHSAKVMDLSMAKKGIDFLRAHSIDAKKVTISFYGGEPLLMFSLIKSVVKYAEEVLIGKEIMYSMTTNGSLLDDEVIQFLREKEFHLLISLDGPENIHDSCRKFAVTGKGTFETVFSNLVHIRECYPDFFEKIGISMVMNPRNDFDLINKLYTEYDGLFNSLQLNATIVDDIYSQDKNVYSPEYCEKRAYMDFLAYLVYLKRINPDGVSPISTSAVDMLVDKKNKMASTPMLPNRCAPSGPCIPGQMRLFMDVDGNLFPCERVSEKSNVMKIGNIHSGFDNIKVENMINIGKLTSDECKKCWAFPQCTICARNADGGDSFSAERKLMYCNRSRAAAYYDLKAMIMLDEIQAKY